MQRYAKFAEGFFSNVALRSGTEWMVSCPFHGGSDSLQFNTVSGKWVCFGCHRGGGIEDLADDTGLLPDFTPRMATLKHKVKMLREDRPREVHPPSWLAQYDVPHDYWDTRFPRETQDEWELGYDWDTDRVTIPLYTPTGDGVLGVIRRAVDKSEPKYLYPRSFQRKSYLFGEHRVPLDEDILLLVEGSLDVVALWEVGVRAVAVLGNSLTRDQETRLRKLCPQHIVLAFDNDIAGEHATERAREKLTGLRVTEFPWPRPLKDFGDLDTPERHKLVHRHVRV